MANTPNKNYNNQNTGANVNTWGIVLNGNLSIIDLNFGGRLNVNLGVTGSNYTVTANQAQNLYHSVSGTLTGNIQYILPALGGFYIIKNITSGAFSLTAICAGGSIGAAIQPGVETLVWVNPDDLSIRSLPFGQYLVGNGVTTGSANAQATAAFGGLAESTMKDGQLCIWSAGFSNAGAMTLDYFGTGAKNVKKLSSVGFAALSQGDVLSGSRYLSVFNSATDEHILLTPSGNLQAANNLSDVSNAVTALSNIFPAGIVVPYAGTAGAPNGWLLCTGQAVSRSTYAALFTAIGTTYGAGDGSTTFNVPDLRGRVIAAIDNLGGSAANRLTATTMSPNGNTFGATGGSQTNTLTQTELPAHTHTINDPGHAHGNVTQQFGSGGQNIGSASPPLVGSGSTNGASTGITINSTGGGAAFTNVQPTMTMAYIIKAH